MPSVLTLIGLLLIPGLAFALQNKPNILLIAVDDLRPELNCYGAAHMVTPHLDQLATEGIRFTRAYTQQAVCLPARISFFSGQHPQTTGITNLQGKYWQDNENPPTLMRHLKDNGYYTVAIGKVLHDEQWKEWDDWTEMMNLSNVFKSRYASPQSEKKLYELEQQADKLGLRGKERRQFVRLGPTESDFGEDSRYHDYAMTDIAIEKLQNLKKEGKPFFMNVGYRKPHLPFVAPKRYWDLYDRPSIQLTKTPEAPVNAPKIALTAWGELRAYKDVPEQGPLSQELARELIHGYYACVSFVDDQIGRLLAALDTVGLKENTLVVVWSDHGWKLGDHGMWCKHTNYEIDTRVPLFIRLPDGRQAGSITSELTSLIDIFPTICEFLDIETPDYCEGTSRAYLFGDSSTTKEIAAYSEFERHGGITGFTVKTGHLRYTEWIHLESREIRERELYDHSIDPLETLNRINVASYAETIPQLSERLHKGPAGRYFDH